MIQGGTLRRLRTIVYRYILLHFRAPARVLDLFFWPVMELFLWGFFTVYLHQNRLDGSGRWATILITALLFWDILFRSQQSVSLAFMEELWTRNVMNILLSPLRSWEWVVGCCVYGAIKTLIIMLVMSLLAVGLYHYAPGALCNVFVPLILNLFLMGWSMGLFTTGLLLRWGHSAEALVWGVPFLVQPFSAIFYPLSVYPAWLKPFCLLLPSTHVMEGLRAVAETEIFPWSHFWAALGLNVLMLFAGAAFYVHMIERGRTNGQIVRMTG